MRRSGTARTSSSSDRDEDLQRVPPLESGDHLTRAEFERRYDSAPDLTKAELIEGIVYVPSPTRHRTHARPHGHLVAWLASYEMWTPGTELGVGGTLRLDLDNEPQPDAFVRIAPERGGQSSNSLDDYVEGAPELVCEVAASSASYDLLAKLNVYRRSGVREYLVTRTLDHTVDWFVLREGRFDRLEPGQDGIHRSEAFPGLWLDTTAFLEGDMNRVMQVLADGLISEPHAAFVAELETRAMRSG